MALVASTVPVVAFQVKDFGADATYTVVFLHKERSARGGSFYSVVYGSNGEWHSHSSSLYLPMKPTKHEACAIAYDISARRTEEE